MAGLALISSCPAITSFREHTRRERPETTIVTCSPAAGRYFTRIERGIPFPSKAKRSFPKLGSPEKRFSSKPLE